MELERLRAYCLGLPGVTESIKWGNNLVFCVGAKMFLIVDMEPPNGASFKVPDEAFEDLANQMGFMQAPYMAKAKWVKAEHLQVMHSEKWMQYVLQSYQLVAAKLTRKLKMELGLD